MRSTTTCLLSLSAVAMPTAAQDAATPDAYQSVLDCRSIVDADARLGCYDRAVAGFAVATASNEVIVVTKDQVDRRERERFGSPTLPKLAGADGEALTTLDTTVAAVRYTPLGKLVIGLPDGATWEQIDTRELAREPRLGWTVKLRKATLGSYLVNVDGQTAIRMRRIDRRR